MAILQNRKTTQSESGWQSLLHNSRDGRLKTNSLPIRIVVCLHRKYEAMRQADFAQMVQHVQFADAMVIGIDVSFL
jgi:hypothetical protein